MKDKIKRDAKGRFVKGQSVSPQTQFKKGEHWRKKKPYWEKEWLEDQYWNKRKSASDIAEEFGVTENAILYWLDKHNIERRTISETRKTKYWGACGVDNPMWNRKGELSPNWKGGITPERQGFYVSQRWKNACVAVWQRDKATCQRCGLKKIGDMPFHIHHIKSFADEESRAEIDNLMLLCEVCHSWVHSRRNIGNEYIQEE